MSSTTVEARTGCATCASSGGCVTICASSTPSIPPSPGSGRSTASPSSPTHGSGSSPSSRSGSTSRCSTSRRARATSSPTASSATTASPGPPTPTSTSTPTATSSSRIVVKVNAVSRLRSELDPRRWAGDLIAMGTNTDPYQRAEGKYRLTRGIVEVLTEFANPFSILTKSTLVLRDLDLLAEAAAAHRRAGQPVDRHARRGGVAGHRARHARTPPAGCGPSSSSTPPGVAMRRARRARPARAVRRPRAARGGRAGVRRRRRPLDLDRAAAPAAGRQRGLPRAGSPRPTRTSWPTTGAATATGPTPPKADQQALAPQVARPRPRARRHPRRAGRPRAHDRTGRPSSPRRRPAEAVPAAPPAADPAALPAADQLTLL